jgi:diguanylate cyclase (GGDEF)-like protein
METPSRKLLTAPGAEYYLGNWHCGVRTAPFGMSANEIPIPDVGIEQRASEIRTNLRRIGRYDWSLWFLAVVIVLSMTFAIATLSTAVIFDPHDPFDHFSMSQSVRGLIGMVLLFSVYTLYQQFQLMGTRRRLAEQVEIATEQHMLAESYLKLAMLDPLTGLHNRRYAQDRMVAEMARAQRQKSSLTILMIDLDDLKRINDRWGHGAGDLVLKTFGARLDKAIRGSDLAVRIGGDEFLVLLPECDRSQVQFVLERLSALEVQVEAQNISFRFSAGCADYQPGETAEELLKRADHALYVEKENRKNQAVPVV